MLSRARALYYEFQFSMIGFPWHISFLLLFMSILVEVLLLEKGNHFTKKLSLPYAQAFKTDVIFTLTKRPPEKKSHKASVHHIYYEKRPWYFL